MKLTDRLTRQAQAEPDLTPDYDDYDIEDFSGDFDYDESVSGGTRGKSYFTRRPTTPEEMAAFGQRPFIRLKWGENPIDPEQQIVVGMELPIVLAHPMVQAQRRSLDPSEIISVDMPTSPKAIQHWLESFSYVPPGTEIIYNLPPLLGSRSSSRDGGSYWAKVARGIMDAEGRDHKIIHPSLLPDGYLPAQTPVEEFDNMGEGEDLSEINVDRVDDPRLREMLVKENERRAALRRVKKGRKSSVWAKKNALSLKIFDRQLKNIIRQLQRGENIDRINIFEPQTINIDGQKKVFQRRMLGDNSIKSNYTLYEWTHDIAFLAAQSMIGDRYETEVFLEDLNVDEFIGDAFQKILSAYRDPSLNKPLSVYFQDSIENAVVKKYSERGASRKQVGGYADMAGTGKEGDKQSDEDAVGGGVSVTGDENAYLTPDEIVIRQDPEVRKASDEFYQSFGLVDIPIEDVIKKGEVMRAATIGSVNKRDPGLIASLDDQFRTWAFSGGYRLSSSLLLEGAGPKLLRHFSFGNIPFVSKRVCPYCGEEAIPEQRKVAYDQLLEEEIQAKSEELGRELTQKEILELAGVKDANFYRCPACERMDIGRVYMDQMQAAINMAALIFLELAADREKNSQKKDRSSYIRTLGVGVPLLVNQSGKARTNEEMERNIGERVWSQLEREHPEMQETELHQLWSKAMETEMGEADWPDKSRGRRFLLIKAGNSLLPRVMGVNKKKNRAEMGIYGHAGIPTQLFNRGLNMDFLVNGVSQFVSPISEHVGTQGYGPGSISAIPQPGLVTNPQEIQGHMIEQLAPKFMEGPAEGVDVQTSPFRSLSPYDVAKEQAMAGGLSEAEAEAEIAGREKQPSRRTRQNQDKNKQRMLRSTDVSRDVVSISMALLDDVGDSLLRGQGNEPEGMVIEDRIANLQEEIRNWSLRILEQFGMVDEESVNEVSRMIISTMKTLDRVSSEEATHLDLPPSYANEGNENEMITWFYDAIQEAGGPDQEPNEIFQAVVPQAIMAAPMVEFAKGNPKIWEPFEEAWQLALELGPGAVELPKKYSKGVRNKKVVWFFNKIMEDGDAQPDMDRMFREILPEVLTDPEMADYAGESKRLQGVFLQAWQIAKAQGYKFKRLKHVMKEGSGGLGGRLALRDDAKKDVAERISAILVATKVTAPENIGWKAEYGRGNLAEPLMETGYPPVMENAEPAVDPETGYIRRDFEQQPQLVQRYQEVPREGGKDITLKEGQFGKPDVIERVVERFAGDEMEKFRFLRDIFWLSSGAFGFGGNWNRSGRVKAEIRQDPSRGIPETSEFVHGKMFSPAVIAQRYGIGEDVVNQMLTATVNFVRAFYVANAGESDDANLAANLLTLIFFLPSPILTSFADAASKRPDVRTERGRQSPVARAAKLVLDLGNVVNEAIKTGGKPDPNDERVLAGYIAQIMRDPAVNKMRMVDYKDEIGSDENLVGMIRDLLTQGPTRRAHDVISIDTKIIDRLILGLNPTRQYGGNKEIVAAIRHLRRVASIMDYDEKLASEANSLLDELIEELIWIDVISA